MIAVYILLNEVAPRPHNNNHHTIEACYVSQFEQHLRAVVGLPLSDTSMNVPATIMYNFLQILFGQISL
jgi:phosphoribosylaminoimidazole carboxylase